MTDEAQPVSPPVPAPAPAADPARREQAVSVLTELLRLMDLGAKLEAKDGPDGGIVVALHAQEELPGVQAGRRSHVIDALQFIANKMVNRVGLEKRWISIGVGGYPEPRLPGERQKRPPPPPLASSPPAPGRPARPAPGSARSASPPPRAAAEDESNLQVPADAVLEALGRSVAQKSATHGRFYALAPMKLEDRTRLLKAAQGVAGVKVFVEGEGRNRRLVFAPEKPAPLPKRSALPQDDEELES